MDGQALRPPRRKGDPIPVQRTWETDDDRGARWTVYDFGASYPIGAVRWNGQGSDDDSVQERIEFSLNRRDWMPFSSRERWDAGLMGGAPARYARIENAAGRVPVFLAGQGLAAELAEDWTRLFHRREGWTGSDGIYSIPLNGVETPGAADQARSLLLFGDTFIGSVDESTDARVSPVMINNSMAILDGDQPLPEKIAFHWNREGERPASAIVPGTPRGLSIDGAYYWLQDGASVGGKFHCFPLIIGPNPDGPEGFEFEVHGITHVSAPMGEEGPMLGEQTQQDTPLYAKYADGRTLYFGGAIMPNTEESGAADPDGYVYVYGLLNDGQTRMAVARVPAAELDSIGNWTYWNGRDWTDCMEDCAPIVPETSTEFSVSRMSGGFLDGKYVIVIQQGGIQGSRVAVYAGDGPAGPFGPCLPVHYCEEPEEGKGIYAYNAKAHPHLSRPGELLASYNVNTTSWDAHKQFGSIYRPRFIRIRQIV